MTLATPLSRLNGVGPKINEKLELLGLYTLGDLIYYAPRRYDDYTNPTPISDLNNSDENQIIKARIIDIETETSPRQRMKITKALVADNSGQISLVWFNQPFLVRQLPVGTTWLFAGKIESDFRGNMSMKAPAIEKQARIIPIYSETAGLTSRLIRSLVLQIEPFIKELTDWVPQTIREQYHLGALGETLWQLHFPDTLSQVEAAKQRLAFDELLLLLLRVNQTRQELTKSTAPSCAIDISAIKQFTQQLPFELTDSQRRVSWQILQDLEKSNPMNRLLEGDVGSGKTVVGAIAALAVVKSGYKVVWMAPTEILAQQHFVTCQKFLAHESVNVGLLTGSTSKKIDVNEYDFIIGTQAVIQETVQFDRLGLIIVDEQHRFGVKQRGHLTEQGEWTPHFLAMTATPIPRTLALTIYGDLSISQLNTVPTGRKQIISRFVGPADRQQAYQFIRRQIQEGRQAFVVCPLIDGGNAQATGQLSLGLEEKRAVLAEFEKLQKYIFPDLRIGLLHGKLKPAEKQAVMEAFKNKEIDILVATAVIEVGIDIPNATVMVIEGADRFGLAQLHQFRGRVGRAEHQSYCFVFTDTQNPATYERLHAFCQTTSGFELAELDLELRGPGQLTGLAQSGLSDLKFASLSDIDLIEQTKEAVTKIIEDGLNKYPALVKLLKEDKETHLA